MRTNSGSPFGAIAVIALVSALLVWGPAASVRSEANLSGSHRAAGTQPENRHESRRMAAWSHGRPIRQSSPFTCGPAALATLLHTYLGLQASEREIARQAHTYDLRWTSLAELQEACASRGLRTLARALTLPELVRAAETRDVPVLVHLFAPEDHFVLFVGKANGRLMMFDPERGNRYLEEETFLKRWSGAALIVEPPAVARKG